MIYETTDRDFFFFFSLSKTRFKIFVIFQFDLNKFLITRQIFLQPIMQSYNRKSLNRNAFRSSRIDVKSSRLVQHRAKIRLTLLT